MIPKTTKEGVLIQKDKNIKNNLERAKDIEVDFEDVKENKL
jgi:rRNA processing protein Krr1/Pno1